MALQFDAVLAVILLLSAVTKAWFGDYGIYALSVVSGVMDVDAITLSLAKSAQQHREVDVAIVGILLACATNTPVKGIMFASITGSKQAIRQVLFSWASRWCRGCSLRCFGDTAAASGAPFFRRFLIPVET